MISVIVWLGLFYYLLHINGLDSYRLKEELEQASNISEEKKLLTILEELVRGLENGEAQDTERIIDQRE